MKHWGGLVVIPLFAGGCAYLLFRPPGLVMFDWAEMLGATDWLAALRAETLPIGEALPAPLVFALPQALWCFALVSFVGLTWRDAHPRVLRVLLALAVVLALGGELGQGIAVVPGTFDIWDLALAALLALGAALLQFRHRTRTSDA